MQNQDPNSPSSITQGQEQMIAQAIIDVLVANGVIHKDARPRYWPELLMFLSDLAQAARDYENSLISQPMQMLRDNQVIDMANAACKGWTRRDNDLMYIEVARSAIAEFCRTNKIPLEITLENAPLGTKAPAINGGAWVRSVRGWIWNGSTTGASFNRPGGDWDGRLLTTDETI